MQLRKSGPQPAATTDSIELSKCDDDCAGPIASAAPACVTRAGRISRHRFPQSALRELVYWRELDALMKECEMRPARVTHAGAADAIGPAQSSSHFESSIESSRVPNNSPSPDKLARLRT